MNCLTKRYREKYFRRLLKISTNNRGNVAELFPCSSCDEIQKLNPGACSGQYVITTSDGSLQQASICRAVLGIRLLYSYFTPKVVK